MSKPTAFPLDESKLPFEIPKDAVLREKIVKLGQMITDRIPAKNRPLTAEDPEYWGLASIVTDEMADVVPIHRALARRPGKQALLDLTYRCHAPTLLFFSRSL